jgi:hypothetical protein
MAGTAGIVACTVLAAWSKRRDSRLAMSSRAETRKSAIKFPVEGSMESTTKPLLTISSIKPMWTRQ